MLYLALGCSNSYTKVIVIAVLRRYLKRDYQINEPCALLNLANRVQAHNSLQANPPLQLEQRDVNTQVCYGQNESIRTNVKAGRGLLFNIGRRHWNDSNLFLPLAFIYPGKIC